MAAVVWFAARVWAAEPAVAVAARDLAPGTVVAAADVRFVTAPAAIGRDAIDPVGRLVVERVLAGEVVRAERLLDVDKPERFTPPGTRALRLPVADLAADALATPARATLWSGEPACALVADTWVVGFGRDGAGNADSVWVVVPADRAVAIVRRGGPLTVTAHAPKATPCS